MSRLPIPTRRVLRSDPDEGSIERVWRNVQRRRAENARRGPRSRWVAAVAAVAAMVVALVVWRDRQAAALAPLRLLGGDEIAALVAPETTPRRVFFSDGSQIELDPGARIEPLENGPTVFSALLASGRATFDVRPGGPRRWTVECGIATVEVVGTRFTVERSPGRARVSVQRGVVLVRGERVRDRVQRLEADQALDVEDLTAGAPALALPDPTNIPIPRPSSQGVLPPPPPRGSAVVAAAAPPSWRKLAQTGDTADAYAELGPAGIASASRAASVDDLLALADVARLSGHPADAVTPLAHVVSDHAGDPRASLAAFTLGRLQLDSLRQPALAAAAFERAVALGLPQSLQEDAFARLVEARAKAGDASGARSAAEEYARRFPAGKRLEEVRRWAEPE